MIHHSPTSIPSLLLHLIPATLTLKPFILQFPQAPLFLLRTQFSNITHLHLHLLSTPGKPQNKIIIPSARHNTTLQPSISSPNNPNNLLLLTRILSHVLAVLLPILLLVLAFSVYAVIVLVLVAPSERSRSITDKP
ncbi:hypothetical protein Fmac_007328 [Flemingia macrophylla]|uniref:Transmembrane protein n=1 Tax=Flemingia macrophylla TaxID=520843 RepID=A0ABD1MU88_9FABA